MKPPHSAAIPRRFWGSRAEELKHLGGVHTLGGSPNSPKRPLPTRPVLTGGPALPRAPLGPGAPTAPWGEEEEEEERGEPRCGAAPRAVRGVGGGTYSRSRSTSGAGGARRTSITLGSSIPSFTFSTRLAVGSLRDRGTGSVRGAQHHPGGQERTPGRGEARPSHSQGGQQIQQDREGRARRGHPGKERREGTA